MMQGWSLRSLGAGMALATLALGFMMGLPLAGTVHAQDTLVQPATVPDSLLPTEAPVDKRIELAINNTIELNLTEPARDIIVGSPDVADVIIRSPTRLFIAGKNIGSTKVFLLDAAGKMIDHYQVSVHPDAKAAEAAISEALPNDRVTVTGAGDSLVLNGSVGSDLASRQATSIARRFVSADPQIINMMRINAEQQVLIKVSVAEVQKSALKELGLENLISPTTVGDLVITGPTHTNVNDFRAILVV